MALLEMICSFGMDSARFCQNIFLVLFTIVDKWGHFKCWRLESGLLGQMALRVESMPSRMQIQRTRCGL